MSKAYNCQNCKFRDGIDHPVCSNPGSQYYRKSVAGVSLCNFCQVDDEERRQETLSQCYVHTNNVFGEILFAPVNLIIWIVKKIKASKEKKKKK